MELMVANLYHIAKPLNTQFTYNHFILNLQVSNLDKNISKSSIKQEHVPITINAMESMHFDKYQSVWCYFIIRRIYGTCKKDFIFTS